MKVHITRVQAAKNKIYRPRDLQKNPDLFPEGSDAWMALNAGYNIKLDDQGFIIDTWDKNGNHYDVATGERIAPSHECGAVTKKDGNPCQRRVKGKTEYC